MKIIDKSKNLIPFCDLEEGDVFYNILDDYYIKTDLLETDGLKIANAASLRTGSLVLFFEKQDVYAVDAYLVIGEDDKKVTN